MKVLFIVGSLRKDSYNLKLANLLASHMDCETNIYRINDIPLFNEDLEVNAPTAVTDLRNRVLESDGIFFLSQEYNHSYSGVLKNTIDWLSRPYNGHEHVLNNKKVAIAGCTPAMFGTINAYNDLVKLLVFLNTKLMTKPRLAIPKCFEGLDQDNKYIKDSADSFIKFIGE